jgi:signal transduction histidine kinase
MIDQTNLIINTNLQEDNKFLGMINATVSHELRNPLNAIIQQNEGTSMNHNALNEILNDMEKHSQ